MSTVELPLLRRKNKILTDLLQQNSAKYKALNSKTIMIESENKSLKQSLKHYHSLDSKYQQLLNDYTLIKQSMNGLQKNYNKILLSKHQVSNKYTTAQNKIKYQQNQIEQHMETLSHLQSQLMVRNYQLETHKSIVNQHRIEINDLQNELVLNKVGNNVRVDSNESVVLNRLSTLKFIRTSSPSEHSFKPICESLSIASYLPTTSVVWCSTHSGSKRDLIVIKEEEDNSFSRKHSNNPSLGLPQSFTSYAID